MSIWVKNNYDKDFMLHWNGDEYLIEAGEWSLVTDDVAKAYFPSEEELTANLPSDRQRAILKLRSDIEIYLSRWGSQINDFVKITGNKEEDVENFLQFLSKFKVTKERPKKRK